MSSTLDHLTPKAAKYLDLPDNERIEKIRSDRWIGYPRAMDVLNKMDELLEHPKSHRMPNLLIVADTNNGKTMIARKFVNSKPGYDNPDGQSITLPAVMVQAPPEPHEGRLYDIILDHLFAPYRPQESASKKQIQVVHLLREINLGVLIIDEIHHLLAGTMNKQKNFLNVLKYIGNEVRIPIVGVGTKDAIRAIQTDPQLANRFEPMALPKWKYDREYLQLLMSFERMIPLRNPSNLVEEKMAMRLLAMSDGLIGELSTILAQAAVHAVKSGKEKIDGKVLDAIGWVSPADRKKNALAITR